jgi:polyisoprenoid-binding protein YceI
MKTNRKVFVLIVAVLLSFPAFSGNYVVDNNQSVVKWKGKKVTGEHYGTVQFKDGHLVLENGKISEGVFHIDMGTIVDEDLKDESWNQKLVGHLKSDDFFSVDKHPVSTLKIKSVKQRDGNTHVFTGDLTIKGITEQIEFEAEAEVSEGMLEASGELVIDRTKYNIKFRSGKFFPDLGDKLIYDNFTLDFKLVANKR